MLRTATSCSLESPPEATGKAREEDSNKVGGRPKIGAVNLTEVKNLKNSTKVKKSAKSKVAKATLPGTVPEAKPFLTPEARLAFTKLRQAFTEAPILHHFDPERYICFETDASGYAIGGVRSLR